MKNTSRSEIEDFLFHEAELLDSWQLDRWAALFTEDGQYLVPPTDDQEAPDPAKSLFLIYDDRHRLEERAKRLMSKAAHAEFPHSRTRHLISNVRIVSVEMDYLIVRCNYVVYRAKGPVNDVYPGYCIYHLVKDENLGWKIKLKRAALDLTVLRPQGKVSIIL